MTLGIILIAWGTGAFGFVLALARAATGPGPDIDDGSYGFAADSNAERARLAPRDRLIER